MRCVILVGLFLSIALADQFIVTNPKSNFRKGYKHAMNQGHGINYMQTAFDMDEDRDPYENEKDTRKRMVFTPKGSFKKAYRFGMNQGNALDFTNQLYDDENSYPYEQEPRRMYPYSYGQDIDYNPQRRPEYEYDKKEDRAMERRMMDKKY